MNNRPAEGQRLDLTGLALTAGWFALRYRGLETKPWPRSDSPGAINIGLTITNMIRHIVLFKVKTSATAEQLAAAEEGLLGMRAGIPEIREVRFGPNLGPSSAEFTHILMVTCDDMGAVQRYLDHPIHRDTVGRFVAPIREARLAADLET